MKNLSRLSLIAAIAILFTSSCKRNYSCNCSYSENGVRTEVTGDIQGSKNHALHECCDIRAAQIRSAGHSDVTCAVPI